MNKPINVKDCCIINIQKIDRNKWEKYVYEHQQGSIFQTPLMFEVYKKSKNKDALGLAIINKFGEIEGLIIGLVDTTFGIIARASVYGAPLCNDAYYIEILLKEFNSFFKAKYFIPLSIDIRNLWDNRENHEYYDKSEYKYIEHLNLINKLFPDTNKLNKTIPRNRRKNIYKGIEKFDVFVELEDFDFNEIYKLILLTYKAAKVPKPSKDFIKRVLDTFSKTGNVGVFIAKYQEISIAIRIELSFKETVYDFFCGSYYNEESRFSNETLVWKAMDYYGKKGFNKFDFGGAGNPNKEYGPRVFKERFGGKKTEWGIYRVIYKPFMWRLIKFVVSIPYPGSKNYFN